MRSCTTEGLHPALGEGNGWSCGERGADRWYLGKYLHLSFRLTDGFSPGWTAAAAFNARVLPFWIHESHSIKDKKAGQCEESIKSLLSAGVSNSNSSRVTAWLNSHTPAKSPVRHNRFMWLCPIVLHLA